MWIALLVIALILIIGHYGLPEKIKPSDYQNPPSKKDIIKGAEPFVLEGSSDTAFLMIHGFEDSPYSFKPLAELIHRNGHTVFAPLLPGHGTSIHRFKKTRYEHWSFMVERIYAVERPKYKHFFLVGFSMGGNLSLKCAISFARTIPPTGVITIAALVFLNGVFDGKFILRDIRLWFSGILKELIDFIPKPKRPVITDIINPSVGYSEILALACVHSLKRNITKIRSKLSEIKVPVCLIQATNDKTVPPENLSYIFHRISSQEKRAFMFTIKENLSTRHVLLRHEQSRSKVFYYILQFIEDCLDKFELSPEKNEKSSLSAGKKLLKRILTES